jgi:pimeloyl-ACP methyl ester carboxylesterase
MAFFFFPQATAFALLSLFLSILLLIPVSSQRPRRWKPRQKHQYRRQQDETDENSFRISVANMTCDFFEQPLNHFDLPRGLSPKFSQRYCTYDDFMVNASDAPVFFYTGNESPLEEYINNTGLIWELAAHFEAQVVFMEHRYEGKSMPDPGIPNCMAYSSSIQALADYANFIERHLFISNDDDDDDDDNTSTGRRPVIAFGGSYGGMLSAWLRMKYPNIVAGAIAGSAPIWGLPRTVPTKIDTAWNVVQRGLEMAYPPMDPKPENNYCASNLLATWPLIQYLANSTRGKALLTETFRLCEPLEQVDSLLEWAQSPWFDLAESSFPYPSSYVIYALTHNDHVKLPAWPLQAACWSASRLHEDWGIRFDGNVSDVRYTLSYGDSGPTLAVDWDKVSHASLTTDDEQDGSFDPAVVGLLASVRDAVSIWFNVTKDAQCYDVSSSAPNTAPLAKGNNDALTPPLRGYASEQRRLQESDTAKEQCRKRMADRGSWPALNCNEEMNLIITEAQGLGRDYLWPPSHPRGTRTHADVIASWSDVNENDDDFCSDPDGIFGFPQASPDPWSTWLDTYYGGLSIDGASNIVFSNGLLDPWSAAGVYAAGMDPTVLPPGDDTDWSALWQQPVPGLYVQNITSGSSSMIALVMAYGGHHTDLMFSSDLDPPDIREARRIEKQYIQRWIDEWRKQQQQRHVEIPL